MTNDVSPVGYWKKIAQDAVRDEAQMVEDARRYILDSAFPAIVEQQPPLEREAFYETLDWDALMAKSPYLWRLAKNDAQQIQRQHLKEERNGSTPAARPSPFA